MDNQEWILHFSAHSAVHRYASEIHDSNDRHRESLVAPDNSDIVPRPATVTTGYDNLFQNIFDGNPNTNSTPTRRIVSPPFFEHGLLDKMRNPLAHDAGNESINTISSGNMFNQGNIAQGVQLGQVTVSHHGQEETGIWDAGHGVADFQRAIDNLVTQPLLDSSRCFDYLNSNFQSNLSYQTDLMFQPEPNINVNLLPDYNLRPDFSFRPESSHTSNLASQQNLIIQPDFNIQPDPNIMIDLNMMPDPSLQFNVKSQSNPALQCQSYHDVSAQPYLQPDVNRTVLCPAAEVHSALNPGTVGANLLHEDIDNDENSATYDSRPELRNIAVNDGSSVQATIARRAQTLNVSGVANRKHRYSEADWKYMRDNHIRRLRVQYKHTVDEIAFELEAIHNFPTSSSTLAKKFGQWGLEFNRNGTDCSEGEPRRRAARALRGKWKKSSGPSLVFFLVTIFKKQFKGIGGESLPSGLTFKPYQYSEKILHELDIFIKGCFDEGTNGKGWTYGTSSFIPPSGAAANSKLWKLLAADCAGIKLLGDALLAEQVLHLFGKILRRAKAAAQTCDPNFLIHFWTICQSLCELRYPRRHDFTLLRIFLAQLRDSFLGSFGRHPLVNFLELLLQVLYFSLKDFRPTIGLAYWKTIDALVKSAGVPYDHRIILKMGSQCTRQWKSKFQARTELLESHYKTLIATLDSRTDTSPEQKVRLLHDYIEAISKPRFNYPDVVEQATCLWIQSRALCRDRVGDQNLRWTKHGQPFAFATELVALHHINEHGKPISPKPDRDTGFRYVSEAIDILRLGDLWCQIRAFAFSRQLRLWMKAFHAPKSKQCICERQQTMDMSANGQQMPLNVLEVVQIGAKQV
ncbi:hypothetical protein BU24DRAFT_465190 [Aaosphaeria arxii CBS 175.79]|uniref:Clr5 domain-containing protein n=1 Tax=Aaosphaeria arxii CBS 175.79 TaxID=1450172 RepID=A0A6A5XHU2_9PLEO|nr:uncharacterized protein BU24DRAFT_465190 [Aaosphaeria arxii CBS 175.79]KAF2012835.1 hypothetical protein BU24DRAFT_465190 [Aaosphaeria arxii CBS 175.79]